MLQPKSRFYPLNHHNLYPELSSPLAPESSLSSPGASICLQHGSRRQSQNTVFTLVGILTRPSDSTQLPVTFPASCPQWYSSASHHSASRPPVVIPCLSVTISSSLPSCFPPHQSLWEALTSTMYFNQLLTSLSLLLLQYLIFC